MEETIHCAHCGGSSCYVDLGFRICSTCDSQLQVIQDTSSIIGTTGNDVCDLVTADDILQFSDDVDYVEICNRILSKLVDQLLTIGVDLSCNISIGYLWALFITKNEDTLLREKPKTAEKKTKKRKSNRKSDNLNLTPTTNLLQTEDAANSSGRKLLKAAKKILVMNETQRMEAAEEEVDDDFSLISNGDKAEDSPTSETKKRVKKNDCPVDYLSFLYVGLRMLDLPVHLSDLLRWVREGWLSNVEIRDKSKVTLRIPREVPIYEIQLLNCCKFMETLGVDELFMAPDVICLIDKFTKDLNLPDFIVELVTNLLTDYPQLNITVTKLRKRKFGKMYQDTIPNYEGRSMALLLFTLKLLFGLDDVTEHKLSEFASVMNGYYRENKIKERLFVYKDWTHYIECRRSVLVQYDYTCQSCWSPEEPCDASQVHNYSERVMGIFNEFKGLHNPSNDAMQSIINKFLADNGPDLDTSTPPDFFMVQTKKLEKIMNTFSLDDATCRILRQKFSSDSINYILQPEKYILALQQMGVEAKVEKKSAQENFKPIKDHIDFVVGRLVQSRMKVITLQIADSEETQNSWSGKLHDKEFIRAASDEAFDEALKEALESCESKVKKLQEMENELEGKSVTLHTPYSEFWTCEFQIGTWTNSDFKEGVLPKYPFSFRWILKLLAQMVEMYPFDIYKELIEVEKVVSGAK